MRRTTLITAAAIAGVALAGAAAITVNVGILRAADPGAIGTLSAANDLVPAEPAVIDVYLEPTTTPAGAPARASTSAAGSAPGVPAGSSGPAAPAAPTTPAPMAETTTFAVAEAGTVTVLRAAEGIRATETVATDGWSWTQTRADSTVLTVAFSSASRTLVFTATLGADGTISGSIAEGGPAAPTASPSTGVPAVAADDHDDAEHDDDDDDEHEVREHEGREDDD